MQFKVMEFYVDNRDFSDELSCTVDRQVRPLCYFIQKAISKEKIDLDIRGLIWIGRKRDDVDCHLSVINNKYLEIEVPFPEEEYKKLPLQKLNKHFVERMYEARETHAKGGDILEIPYPKFSIDHYNKLPIRETNEFFAKVLKNGLKHCDEKYKIPKEKIIEKLDGFSENGYEHNWTFKTKRLKGTKVKCVFDCRWTIAFFSMTINVYKDNERVFSEEVIHTCPGEYSFAHLYKKVDLQDKKIIIVDKFGYEVYEKDLTEFI